MAECQGWKQLLTIHSNNKPRFAGGGDDIIFVGNYWILKE